MELILFQTGFNLSPLAMEIIKFIQMIGGGLDSRKTQCARSALECSLRNENLPPQPHVTPYNLLPLFDITSYI
jgi:hypothetical protein